MNFQSIYLEGRQVYLEPLATNHIFDLLEVSQDESLWKYMFYGNLSQYDLMENFINTALSLKETGTDFPFAVIHKKTGKAIGSTRFRDICTKHMKLEIGGTWYGTSYQRTGINLECKYVLLRYAFETFGSLRVQFKTDIRNQRSRQSLEKLGATQEGILRRSAIMPDGLIRDTAIYSILDTEWSWVKSNIEHRLEHYQEKNISTFNFHFETDIIYFNSNN